MKSFASALLALAIVSSTSRLAVADDSSDRFLDEAIVDVESGILSILKNDGRYGEDGTDFGVAETNQRKNLVVANRLSGELVKGAHRLVFLYAPLDVTTQARLRNDLQFRRQLFLRGTSIDHRYLFDGYRASYLYRATTGPVEIEVGGSLQIRNAKVAFVTTSGSDYVEESDIGVVPALKVRATYRAPNDLYAMLDADGSSTFGLVGDTEGGLYDVGLTLGVPVTDELDLFLRARGVGGGATVPDRDIYNWAHFLSFSGGLRINLSQLD